MLTIQEQISLLKDFIKSVYTIEHNLWQHQKPLVILPGDCCNIFLENDKIYFYINAVLIFIIPNIDEDHFQLTIDSDKAVIAVDHPSLNKKIEYTLSRVKHFDRSSFEYYLYTHCVAKTDLSEATNLVLIPKDSFTNTMRLKTYQGQYEHLLNKHDIYYGILENDLYVKIWISRKDLAAGKKVNHTMSK